MTNHLCNLERDMTLHQLVEGRICLFSGEM